MISTNKALLKRKQNLINHIHEADEELTDTLLAVVYDYVYTLDAEPISEVVNVDDFSPELREKYEQALKQSEEGEGISHEEMQRKIRKLLNLNDDSNIQPFTPEQQQKYDTAISELDTGDGKPHEEFMAQMKKKSPQ